MLRKSKIYLTKETTYLLEKSKTYLINEDFSFLSTKMPFVHAKPPTTCAKSPARTWSQSVGCASAADFSGMFTEATYEAGVETDILDKLEAPHKTDKIQRSRLRTARKMCRSEVIGISSLREIEISSRRGLREIATALGHIEIRVGWGGWPWGPTAT